MTRSAEPVTERHKIAAGLIGLAQEIAFLLDPGSTPAPVISPRGFSVETRVLQGINADDD
jgi:hypothetical protein